MKMANAMMSNTPHPPPTLAAMIIFVGIRCCEPEPEAAAVVDELVELDVDEGIVETD